MPDAIAITAKERESVSLDKNMIIIADSSEYYYALDLNRKRSDGNVPVIELLPQKKPKDCAVVSDSFGEFLFYRTSRIQM